MNILVTGSEGTLGKPLVKELRKRGHSVSTVDLQHGSHPHHIRADIADWREWFGAFRTINPEMVFHLAAEFGRLNGEDFYERLWRTNVIGTRNVLETQKCHKFKLIFASSSEVYGNVSDAILRETLVEDGLSYATMAPYENDYALSKRVNEQQVTRFRRQFDCQSMILRFFNAYGPGESYHGYRSVVCSFVWRLLHGMPIRVYQGYHRVFMYVDDFIPTLATAARNFVNGETINIGGIEYRGVVELAKIVCKETGADPELIQLVGEESHNTKNKRPDIQKAVKYFGHNPTVTLEEGVAKTVAWMREQM